MSAPARDKDFPIVRPKPSDVVERIRQDIFSSFACHKLGRIDSFDPIKQTARVEILGKLIVGGREADYPVLLDCPVWVMRGGAAAFTMPITKGDYCLVLFNDRDIDNWYEAGEALAPSSYRMHDLADGLAIVGFSPQVASLESYSTTRARLLMGDVELSTAGDKWLIKNNLTTLKLALNALTAALKAFKDTRGDTPDSATVTAITAAETLINQILE